VIQPGLHFTAMLLIEEKTALATKTGWFSLRKPACFKQLKASKTYGYEGTKYQPKHDGYILRLSEKNL
jgi:hypothetical protein